LSDGWIYKEDIILLIAENIVLYPNSYNLYVITLFKNEEAIVFTQPDFIMKFYLIVEDF
jgi:hypothetical protein